MADTPRLAEGTVHSATVHSNLPQHAPTAAANSSLHEGCVTVVFSQMKFFPWDNPDNIVTADVETVVSRLKNNLMVLLFLVGAPSNVINMVVFYKQGLKDRVNLCLFALSLSDGLYLLNAMMHHGEQLYLQFTTKERFGPTDVFLTNVNSFGLVGFSLVSPVLSAIIAVERCLCVYNPLKFQSLLRTRTMAIVLAVVHIVVLGLFFFVVFRYRVGCIYDPETDVVMKTIVEGTVYKAHKEFIDHLDSFVFGVGLPSMEMTVVTSTTILTIVKLRQIMTWRSGTSSGSISAREVALTKMLVANSIFFMACITPVALIRFSWLFFPEMNSGGRHQNFFLVGIWVTEIFLLTNSAFNFFIYYVMGSRYRETFWLLVSRKKRAEQV